MGKSGPSIGRFCGRLLGVDVNLLSMLQPVVLLALLGWAISRDHRDRNILLIVGMFAIGMAVQRGFYWNIFGRGHGFFTANRTSALVVFLALLLAPTLWVSVRDRS